jgi:hypothetical protein
MVNDPVKSKSYFASSSQWHDQNKNYGKIRSSAFIKQRENDKK